VLHSYDSATVIVALTDVPLNNIIFRRRNNNIPNFTIQGFEFIFRGQDAGYEIYYYTIRRGDISILFSFFGLTTTRPCGPLSNLNFVTFVWDNSERLSFGKYAILLFPPVRSRPPVLLFLQYHRAWSDGWTDIDDCLACLREYQRNLQPFNNCNQPDRCSCDICRRQPPSLLNSASYILFRFVLDLERFELNCYTTYPQYQYAVQSGCVDDMRPLPPEFPFMRIRCTFSRHAPNDRYHYHCPGRADIGAKLRANFETVAAAIQCLLIDERLCWCKHCERGLFFLQTCGHHNGNN
jgi:hypothetical protein